MKLDDSAKRLGVRSIKSPPGDGRLSVDRALERVEQRVRNQEAHREIEESRLRRVVEAAARRNPVIPSPPIEDRVRELIGDANRLIERTSKRIFRKAR